MAVNVKRALDKWRPHLLQARKDGLNEADTVQRIIKVFEEVLGYNPLDEIARECPIRDKVADIALKIDGEIKLTVEAKAAGVKLNDSHIDQAKRYAADEKIPWALLTNGVDWLLYHLTFRNGAVDQCVRTFTVNLESDSLKDAAKCLAVLHRQSVVENSIEEYWEHRSALGVESVGHAIFTEDVIKLIRRHIRRRKKTMVDEKDLAQAVHDMFSVETQDILGSPKIKRNRKTRKSSAKSAVLVEAAAEAVVEATPAARTEGQEDLALAAIIDLRIDGPQPLVRAMPLEPTAAHRQDSTANP